MPELAETLRIATDISDLRLGDLRSIIINDVRCIESKVENCLNIQQFPCIVRWAGVGKYVALVLCDASFVTFRLGMSGRFIASQYMNEVDKKHIIITFSFDKEKLYYVDYRKFSRVDVIENDEFHHIKRFALMYSYESDLIKKDFEIKKITKKPKITEMLSEGTMTGIGNYLANEALAITNNNPYIPFDSLDQKKKVYLEAQKIAYDSYKAGGNTFNGGYKRVSGIAGTYKTKFYGNEFHRKKNFRGRPIFTDFDL